MMLMKEYFRARGYPDKLVNNDLKKVSTARSTLLTPTSHNESTSNKVPLVLTYNPFNVGPRRILLDNFNILSSDPEAHRIFPKLLLVSYQHERNLSDISSYTLLMPHHLPLMLVNCPANGFFARRAST